jgi:hypothetical protein
MEKMMKYPSIADVVAWVETKNNRSAVRFEPTTYNKFGSDAARTNKIAQAILARIQIINVCSVHTAAMIYSSSWGAYQLMGFNVYAGPSFDMPVAEYLACETVQRASFVEFLTRCSIGNVTPEQLAASQSLRLKFAMKYNGSIAYETPLCAALEHFGFSVAKTIN